MQKTQQESINLLRSLSSPANAHGNEVNNTNTASPPYQNSSNLPPLSDEGRPTLKQDSMLWLETFVRPTHSPTCRCQCHRSSSVASPSSLQRILGAFSLSYNAIPIFSPIACDFAACIAASGPSLRFHDSLPSWLFLRAIVFSVSFSTITGSGASLHLKVPRSIQAQDSIWEMLRCGDLDRIDKDLQQGEIPLLTSWPTACLSSL